MSGNAGKPAGNVEANKRAGGVFLGFKAESRLRSLFLGCDRAVPSSRQSSGTGVPASARLSTAMIWLSVKWEPPRAGLRENPISGVSRRVKGLPIKVILCFK
jgi:hypothetical protein